MFDNFILKVRNAKPSEEANKNLVYTMLIFLITLGTILGRMINEEALMALMFFLFLFVFLMESLLWDFALCPEKKGIRLNVYINRIMYVGLIIVLNFTGANIIKKTEYTIGLFLILNLIILINGIIIKYKANYIKMNNEESMFQDEVSDWDKNNVSELAESITYTGIGFVLVSFVYGAADFGIFELIVKVILFSIGYDRINSKILKIENEKYKKNIKKINISLVIGLIFNVICLFAASYFKTHIIENYKNICDLIVFLSFLSFYFIINQYRKIAIHIKKIRYEQYINDEELSL